MAVLLGVVLFAAGILWFAIGEYYRGRPTTSAQVSFVLKWANPLGAILFCILAMLCFWFR